MLALVILSSPGLLKLPLSKHNPNPPQAIDQLQTELETGFLVTNSKEKSAVLTAQTTGKQQSTSRALGATEAEALGAQGQAEGVGFVLKKTGPPGINVIYISVFKAHLEGRGKNVFDT